MRKLISALAILIATATILVPTLCHAQIPSLSGSGNDEFSFTFNPEEKDSLGQPAYSLLFKRVMEDARTGNVKDLKGFTEVTETGSLKNAYRYAVSEGQGEVVKFLDKTLQERNPKLFRGEDPLRETLIVAMMMEQKDLGPKIAERTCVGTDCPKIVHEDKRSLEVLQRRQSNNDLMIALLLELGARGDRTTSYRGPRRMMYV